MDLSCTDHPVKSSSGPFGPYPIRQALIDLRGPIPSGGVAHQGGLVQTRSGAWHYLAFVDAYPGGRMPVLAPVSRTSDGRPVVQLVDGTWDTSYPSPGPAVSAPPRQVTPVIGVDTFDCTPLKPRWEGNHNPGNTKWSVDNGLTLRTAAVTDDLDWARNTLPHRIQEHSSTATVQLDHSAMQDGDRAGLALLRDMLRESSARIGVKRDGGATRVAMVNGPAMDRNWNTTDTGTEAASTAVSGGLIWLRASADIRPGAAHPGAFSCSTDGCSFTRFGPTFSMGNDWPFFMGYRFALFNHATQALGGAVRVARFELSTP